MRTLLILALALIGFWWVRRSLQEMQRRRHDRAAREAGAEPERMVACAHCGLHVPESDCVRGEGQVFCSVEHRRLGVRR